MTQNPYDYENRQGIHPVGWDDFHGLCKGLVQAIAPFDPEIILAIGRGGYYPGTLIAHMLQAEIYPVRLSRRVHDVVTYDHPVWLVRPPELVRDRRVLVVDEISSTGETLTIVKQESKRLGAAAVRCAVLYAHTRGSAIPEYVGLVSDQLLLNPWDREIFKDGVFRFNPEYVAALNEQGLQPAPSLLIGANTIKPAKGRAGGR
jgi:hypoxanthine phosphoribosyltransferase